MSTSLLYHAFGIRGYQYVRTEYVRGEIHFTIEQREPLRCRHCQSDEVIYRGTFPRRFRGLPIGGRPVWVLLPVQRVECRRCGLVQRVDVAFADRRRSYTRAFERYALDLCRCMTIQDVAHHLGVSWDVIKSIHKRYLQRRFSKPKLKKLTRIGIDEICVGRPRKFLTIVLDLATGAVVYVGKGKGKEALQAFWRKLRRSRAKIDAVATDMAPAYVAAVLENLPAAALVLDRFHIVKYFNEKITLLRRQVQRGAEAMDKEVLKGTRWLLVKNPENLQACERPRQRRTQTIAGSPGDQRAADAGVLPERGSPAVLGAAGQGRRRTVPRRLAGPGGGLRRDDPEKDRPPAANLPIRAVGLVRPSDLDRPVGGDQQQDQDPPTSSLRLPRSGVLQTPNLQSAREKVRFSRMSHLSHQRV